MPEEYSRTASAASDRDPAAAIIDLRDNDSYQKSRPVGAVRLTQEDILERAYLLPPRYRRVVLVGGTNAQATSILEAFEHAGRTAEHCPADSWRERFAAETGRPSRDRLWEPAATVARAAAYRDTFPGRRALDLACGSGRNAVYLAQVGFEVTAVDARADALARAEDLASRHGVTIRTVQRDLEVAGALEGMSADLIVVVRFLERGLFSQLPGALVPGGILAYETFTVDQAVRGHPRQSRFMLQRGELRNAFPALANLEYDEGEFSEAHLARLIARRV